MKKQWLALALCLPLSACVFHVGGDHDGDYVQHSQENREERNREAIGGFMPGLALDQVQTRLGTPDFDNLLADGHRVLYYRTQRRHGDGMTTRDECTPLIFKDGILLGWGDLALQRL
ncbi:DUF3192 domain-containing protein [Gallaecimonas sp. GXIMD4217]|uniref:DUF3192 domain-containing protein n=1 Tax=Gallaecimonas sp. GXIMD4217 TaxID=3131927 RepID=UPI00311AE45D